MIVKHYTHPEHVSRIRGSGLIMTECHNLGPATDSFNQAQYKAQGGLLVWLTEEDHAYNSVKVGHEHIGFAFDTDTTPNLERWTTRKNRRRAVWTKQQRRIIELMEFTARNFGDEPDRWWVSAAPVSLEHCINLHNLTTYIRPPGKTYEQWIEARHKWMTTNPDKYWRTLYNNSRQPSREDLLHAI
jgi:hypothetical protein